jgi:hypothetical protein
VKWRCAECSQVYDEAPETCVCGSSNVNPDDGGKSRFSPAALRERLVDPQSSNRSLVREEPFIALAFRFVVALAFLGGVLLAVQYFA